MQQADNLSIADTQVAGQVIKEAIEHMTKPQVSCLILSMMGLTQSQIAWVCKVSQPTVCEHLQKVEQKIREISPKYL